MAQSLQLHLLLGQLLLLSLLSCPYKAAATCTAAAAVSRSATAAAAGSGATPAAAESTPVAAGSASAAAAGSASKESLQQVCQIENSKDSDVKCHKEFNFKLNFRWKENGNLILLALFLSPALIEFFPYGAT